MAESHHAPDTDDRVKRAAALLQERLARPEDAGDRLGGLRAQIEPGRFKTTLIVALIAAAIGLLIVWKAEPIARGIQEFTAGPNAADSPVIVYSVIGWVLFCAPLVSRGKDWSLFGVCRAGTASMGPRLVSRGKDAELAGL